MTPSDLERQKGISFSSHDGARKGVTLPIPCGVAALLERDGLSPITHGGTPRGGHTSP